MPVLAQITGAVALTALIMAPWWSRVDHTPAAASAATTHGTAPSTPAPEVASAASSPVAAALPLPAPAASATPATTPDRPAHLNLDVRHTFSNVTMLVTVDGKRAFESRLEGTGKKFKMFGKRGERSFTRTLDLEPGVRLVRVNLKSAEDKFDQTRVERFELASASVASLRINADKEAGITAIADRPSVSQKPEQVPAAAAPVPASRPVAASAVPLPAPASAAPATASITQQADALAELLNSLRSMLIAIAGFVASAATGFIVQEYLRSKKGTIFATAGGGTAVALDGEDDEAEDEAGERKERRRRRRSSASNMPAVDS